MCEILYSLLVLLLNVESEWECIMYAMYITRNSLFVDKSSSIKCSTILSYNEKILEKLLHGYFAEAAAASYKLKIKFTCWNG